MNEVFYNKKVNNNSVLFLVDNDFEKNYLKLLENLMRKKQKICSILVSNTYSNISEELVNNNINSDDHLFFIDTLTSHYHNPENIKNCFI